MEKVSGFPVYRSGVACPLGAEGSICLTVQFCGRGARTAIPDGLHFDQDWLLRRAVADVAYKRFKDRLRAAARKAAAVRRNLWPSSFVLKLTSPYGPECCFV